MLPYIPIAKARGFTATFGKIFEVVPNISRVRVPVLARHGHNRKENCRRKKQILNRPYW